MESRRHGRAKSEGPAPSLHFPPSDCLPSCTAQGGWALANDSGEGGANIGAGILMLFGYAVGALGLVVGAAALIAYGMARRQGRLHT